MTISGHLLIGCLSESEHAIGRDSCFAHLSLSFRAEDKIGTRAKRIIVRLVHAPCTPRLLILHDVVIASEARRGATADAFFVAEGWPVAIASFPVDQQRVAVEWSAA